MFTTHPIVNYPFVYQVSRWFHVPDICILCLRTAYAGWHAGIISYDNIRLAESLILQITITYLHQMETNRLVYQWILVAYFGSRLRHLTVEAVLY